jgi:hypothetical protein
MTSKDFCKKAAEVLGKGITCVNFSRVGNNPRVSEVRFIPYELVGQGSTEAAAWKCARRNLRDHLLLAAKRGLLAQELLEEDGGKGK